MPRSSGFTLVEALVAVTLLALLFGALMPVFQQGLAVLRSGDHHSRAVLLAQSILDRQLVSDSAQKQSSAQEDSTHGNFGDYHWQVTRTPFALDDPQRSSDTASPGPGPRANATMAAESGSFALTEISVVVRWPDNEFGVQLHTLVLEAAQ